MKKKIFGRRPVSDRLQATARRLLTEHLHEHMSPDRLRILKLAEEEERRGLARIHDLLGGAA